LKFAFPAILQLANDPEEMVAAEALEEFDSLLPTIPKLSPVYVTEVVNYLGRSHRDRMNQDWHSSRHRLFVSLFSQGFQAIATNVDEIHGAAVNHAKDDPWDSLQLVFLLLHFELYRQAAETAHCIGESQPKTAAFEQIVAAATIANGIARAEAKVAEGKPDLACEALVEIARLLNRKDENTNSFRIISVGNALSLAHQIAERLQKL
jgi:hypothetical protein